MNGRDRKAGRKAHRVNFIGQGVNMAQAVKNSGSLRVIILQNKLDTPHYACHFKPIWEDLGCGHYAWLYSDPQGHVPKSEQITS